MEKHDYSIEEKDNFIKTICKNTCSDYYTPNIKAEVILDMLLTEEIAHWIAPQGILITKEMSIEDDNGTNRGKKVDYVVKAEGKIWLVELKTTSNSYNSDQDRIYSNFGKVKDGNELLRKLCRILKQNQDQPYQSLKNYLSKKLKDDKNIDQDIDSLIKHEKLIEAVHNYQRKHKVKSTGKYIHTVACILQNTTEDDWKLPLGIAYIFPDGVKGEEKEKYIILSDIKRDDYKNKIIYDMVMSILF